MTVNEDEVEAWLSRVRERLESEDYQLAANMAETIRWLDERLEEGDTSLAKLRQMLFGAKSERTGKVFAKDEKVEPNGGLGQAMRYMLKRWEALTLFLRQAGAPLDNNITERALKMAILHRKNSLFYKTENGARVGDILMSLIHTCRLNDVNPFDYLTALQKNKESVHVSPASWLPWNYHQQLEPASQHTD